MTKLTHITPDGEARMVDVSAKPETARMAIAEGAIRMRSDTHALLKSGNGPKGDVLGPARIAGILAAKKTAELIPLCHPIPINSIAIEFTFDEIDIAIRARAEVRTFGRTGAEVEALTATLIALLTIYDMAKAVDRAMVIGEVRLLEKSGGVRGHYRADGNV